MSGLQIGYLIFVGFIFGFIFGSGAQRWTTKRAEKRRPAIDKAAAEIARGVVQPPRAPCPGDGSMADLLAQSPAWGMFSIDDAGTISTVDAEVRPAGRLPKGYRIDARWRNGKTSLSLYDARRSPWRTVFVREVPDGEGLPAAVNELVVAAGALSRAEALGSTR